jgi:hypothetical protein
MISQPSMPAWPKSILTFGASILTTRTKHRLKKKHASIPAQNRIFRDLTQKLATTAFWKPAGVEAGMSYRQFNSRVAPRRYEDLTPAIEKMKRGQQGILWPGPCFFYATPAGTSGGETRYVPITADMLTHFRQAGRDALLYYTARSGNVGVLHGRHLILGGSTTLIPLVGDNGFAGFAGSLGGIAAVNFPRSLEQHFLEPGAAIAQLTDWPTKLKAVVERTRTLDITLLAGIPNWVLTLVAAIRGKSAADFNLQKLWPNLECFVHSGVPIAPFADELRAALGPTVNFHEVYSAAEAFIAAQDNETRGGLRLMTDVGIFYEFLPMEDFDEARIAQLTNKMVPLEGVRPGVDYAMFVTTPAGLCRHLMGDVVRFISVDPPRLQYTGRTKLQLNPFGERVSEKDLTDALVSLCQRNAWTIVNFHVAPLFTNPLYGTTRGRHEWWIELKPGTVITPTGPQMAVELDMELQRLNPAYEIKRKGYGLESPIVRLVMPGLFEHWMRHQGKWSGQHKMPRCRSDREVADQLAQIAQFAKD